LAGETEALGENMSHRHFVHHKSQLTRPGIETGRRGRKPACLLSLLQSSKGQGCYAHGAFSAARCCREVNFRPLQKDGGSNCRSRWNGTESLSGDKLSFIRKLPQGAYKTLYLFYTFIILDWKFVGSNPQADYLN
jgi:hypothetical protein